MKDFENDLIYYSNPDPIEEPRFLLNSLDELEKSTKYSVAVSYTHLINSQSKRVIEKSGFRFVKENTQIARDGHEYISLYYVLDNPLKKN